MIKTIPNLFIPPSFEDNTENRITQILFRTQILTLGLFGIVIIFSAIYDFRIVPLVLLIGFVLIILTMYISHLRHIEFASTLLLGGFLFIITYFAFIGQGIHDEVIIAYPVLVMLSSLLLAQLLFLLITSTSLTILSLGFLTWAELSNLMETGVDNVSSPFDFVTTTLIILFTAVIMRTIIQILNSTIQRGQQSQEALKVGSLGFRGVIGTYGKADCQSAPTFGINPLNSYRINVSTSAF